MSAHPVSGDNYKLQFIFGDLCISSFNGRHELLCSHCKVTLKTASISMGLCCHPFLDDPYACKFTYCLQKAMVLLE